MHVILVKLQKEFAGKHFKKCLQKRGDNEIRV
jgi:hypothetical protein